MAKRSPLLVEGSSFVITVGRAIGDDGYGASGILVKRVARPYARLAIPANFPPDRDETFVLEKKP